ncbi:MAG: DEAD/DEAH box helicase [Sphaerospermopsis kisseleviana]
MTQLTIQTRDYQDAAIEHCSEVFWGQTPQKRASLIAGCGAGKTVVAAQISWLLHQNHYRSLIIVPYTSLLDQFVTTLICKGFKGTKKMYEMVIAQDPEGKNPYIQSVKGLYNQFCKNKLFPKSEIAYYAGGKPTTKDYSNIKVVVAMAQTIESRGFPDLPFKIVFFDESHLSYFRRELQSKFSEYRYSKEANEVLLTATPWRGDGAEYPQKIKHYQVITTKELIETGFNCPYFYYPLRVMERKQALKSSDFSEAEELAILDKMFNPNDSWEYLHNPSAHLDSGRQLESVFKQQTIFFFGRKNIALKYMDYFRDKMKQANINKELMLICDSTPQAERVEAFSKFRERKAILFTVTCLAIGFDEPSVENIVLLRTFSMAGYALFIQIFGRGLRPSTKTGKSHCNVFDLCSNPYFADALPDMITTWDLTDPKCIIPTPKEGKVCEHCGTTNGRTMKNCYMCGEELPKAKEKSVEEELDELTQRLINWGNSQGYFNINDDLLADLQTQHLRITNACNQLQIRDQAQQLELNKCLVSLKNAIGGFVFRNDPLPIEKLQIQTYKLVELAEALFLQNYEVYPQIQQFEGLTKKFLQDGETIKAADRALKKLREMAENQIKFLEISSNGGLSQRDIYRNLLKIGVLVKEYAPGWAYMQMSKMYGEKVEIDKEWKKHAIFGENPTYGNYLKYRHFLWSKYSKREGSNKDVFRELSAEFGTYCIEFNDRYMIENSKIHKVA